MILSKNSVRKEGKKGDHENKEKRRDAARRCLWINYWPTLLGENALKSCMLKKSESDNLMISGAKDKLHEDSHRCASTG